MFIYHIFLRRNIEIQKFLVLSEDKNRYFLDDIIFKSINKLKMDMVVSGKTLDIYCTDKDKGIKILKAYINDRVAMHESELKRLRSIEEKINYHRAELERLKSVKYSNL